MRANGNNDERMREQR